MWGTVRRSMATGTIMHRLLWFFMQEAALPVRDTINSRSNDSYYMTYKGAGLMVREEYNLPLTKEAYDHLVQKIDGRLIEKTRYLIPLDGDLTAELDVFEGDLAPLTLVEVEFDSVDAANEFTAPDWFGEDVTESGKYHNSYLSRLENS